MYLRLIPSIYAYAIAGIAISIISDASTFLQRRTGFLLAHVLPVQRPKQRQAEIQSERCGGEILLIGGSQFVYDAKEATCRLISVNGNRSRNHRSDRSTTIDTSFRACTKRKNTWALRNSQHSSTYGFWFSRPITTIVFQRGSIFVRWLYSQARRKLNVAAAVNIELSSWKIDSSLYVSWDFTECTESSQVLQQCGKSRYILHRIR